MELSLFKSYKRIISYDREKLKKVGDFYALTWLIFTGQVTYVPLCMGGSKGKAGIHLIYYPENRDAFEMYPGKVMHMIGV